MHTERRQRFEQEARIVGALNHPNIVTLHSVESSDGQLFITMELVRGAVLADRIPRGGMNLAPFLDLAIPMADALAAAHGSGVVHRDLKPHNVMVSEEGRVKVLDFGLAQTDARHLVTASTSASRAVGSASPMSRCRAESTCSASPSIPSYAFDSREFQRFTEFGERPAWLNDSRRLLFMDSQKIYVLDTVTRQVKEVYSAAPRRLQSIVLSADNRSIGVSLAINEADIWLASLK